MNAVNLLPAGAVRGRGAGLSVSRPFLGLVATLGIALVATILYVSAHDTVNSRQTELHRLQAATARWTAAAAAYDPAVEASSVRAKTIATVRTLSDERYDWSTLLTQIAWRLPAHAELSSLEATAPTTTAVPLTSDATSTIGATSNGIEIAACATSQNVVAATMTSLRRVAGVSQVTLSSSSRSGATSAVGGASCSLPIQFTVTLSFTSSAAGTSSTGTGSTVGTEAADTESGQ